MTRWYSRWATRAPFFAAGRASALFTSALFTSASGCSSTDRTPFADGQSGLACGSDLRPCDIHEAACRQDVLDAVACLRDYTEQVQQPQVRFIRLRDLQQSSPEVNATARVLRSGFSLFGLVAATEVDDDAALDAQTDTISAFYAAEDDAVFVLENPGGQALTEAELGTSVEVYLMNVLAHEYVHFLQDREFDLAEVSDGLPDHFDPAMAVVSAIEGEATFYEALYSYQLAGTATTDREVLRQFERYVDFAEEEIRRAESPALEARTLFPYSYGAHSNAVLYASGGIEALTRLRASRSTLEYLQRRWTEVTPVERALWVDGFDAEYAAFQRVGQEQFGPWIVNAFWSRVAGGSTTDALAIAQRWRGDELAVWRGRDSGEIVANWAIEFEADETQLVNWASALAESKPRRDSAWTVRVTDKRRIEITSSTVASSAVVSELADEGLDYPSEVEAGAPEEDSSEASAEEKSSSSDAGASDAGRRFELARWDNSRGADEHASGTAHRSPDPRLVARRLRTRERLRRFVLQKPARHW